MNTLRAGGWRGTDRALTAWGRANRFAGSGDRAAIADLIYDALRRRRSLGARLGADDPDGRALMLALAAEAGDPDALFNGAGYAPAPTTEAERAALAATPEIPEAVRLDLPDGLMDELRRSLGDDLAGVATLLQSRAAVDLRVNVARTDPAAAIRALARDGVEAAPGPLSPTCLRVTAGARKLRAAKAYLSGMVEVQDAASQAIADLADVRPGEVVLDYCAGGGGKALALAAKMQGRGRVLTHDVDPRRMRDLPARAARAGAAVEILPGPPPVRLRGACDLVFVDAPCSGTGAWRRNPDGKWTLSWAEVEALAALQRRILIEASAFVAPGGRLVYATCSLLRIENEDALVVAPPGWTRAETLRLTPLDGGDGFFAAVLRAP
ncbi:MAG: 16S rRNA (cytosine967-C5)-methyltransferase [Paracoccaceae bacterium]